MANPNAPITKSPIIETFEVTLNSSTVGFLRRRQTRRYLLYCDNILREVFFIITIIVPLGF